MAYTDFYVRHGAAASDDNAGAPYGANDGPVVTRRNVNAMSLGSTYALTNADSTGWGAAAVGDFVRWDPAGSAELARIVTLSYGGNDEVIEVLPVSSTFSANAGKTAIVGGAFATLQGALDVIEATAVNAAGDSPRILLDTSAAHAGGTSSLFTGTSYQLLLTIQGDGGEAVINGGLVVTHNRAYLRDLYVNQSNNAHGVSVAGYCYLRRVRVNNSGVGSYDGINASAAYAIVLDCTVEAAPRHGIALEGAASLVLGSVAHNCGSTGIYVPGNNSQVLGSVAHDNGVGIQVGRYMATLHNCTAVDNTSHGLVVDYREPKVVGGCVSYGNGGYGLYYAGKAAGLAIYNAFGANTSGEIYRDQFADANVTLVGDPFVARAGGDYRIDPRTAAGRQLIAAGFPADLNDLAAHVDIGALQVALASAIG